jgi:hypothetical protein
VGGGAVVGGAVLAIVNGDFVRNVGTISTTGSVDADPAMTAPGGGEVSVVVSEGTDVGAAVVVVEDFFERMVVLVTEVVSVETVATTAGVVVTFLESIGALTSDAIGVGCVLTEIATGTTTTVGTGVASGAVGAAVVGAVVVVVAPDAFAAVVETS